MERRHKEAAEAARRVAEISEREAREKAEAEDRDAARAMYGAKLKEWAEEANGTRKNIRLLLSTMHAVLWPDAKWEAVPMAKLIDARRVRAYYLRAVAVVHPDKHHTLSAAQIFVATSIFHALETAFRLFEETELASA